MKNFGLLILGVILGACAMYFYSSNSEPHAIAESEIIKPNGLISSKEATILNNAYSLRHSLISDSLFRGKKTGDNRSSWWPIEEIQNYINHAENQAGELGYKLDGLRLYLGAEPEVKGQQGYTTLFFVPTGTKNMSKGSVFALPQGGGMDVPGGDGLNKSEHGKPPGANYPQ